MSSAGASAAARRFALVARVHIDAGAPIDERLLRSVSEQLGLRPHGWQSLFEGSDQLLDTINDVLVEECTLRIRAAAGRCALLSDHSDGLRAMAVAIAESLPLDRSAIVVRLERRLRAFRRPDSGPSAVAAERLFVREAVDSMNDLVRAVGRDFTWPPRVAVRAIFAAYERALEGWLLDGGDGSTFVDSPFIQRTLPTILGEMTTSLSPGHPDRATGGLTVA